MEEMGIGYRQVGEVQIPNLVVEDTTYFIGFWGQRHKEYLRESHRLIYYNLLTTGTVSYTHLPRLTVSTIALPCSTFSPAATLC